MTRPHHLAAAALAGALVVGGLHLELAPPAVAQASPVLGDPDAIADVAERVTPSVVNVSTTTVQQAQQVSPFFFDPFFGEGERPGRERYGKSLGSGVIVSSKGLVLTNNHVVANAKDIQVSTADGTEYDADLVGADPKSDLAVLKLRGAPKGLVALPFGDSSKMRLGEVVLAVGNPFGVGQTVTMGIVSAKGRANMGIVAYEDFIQTDAAINPGNSGGALVNLKGELVGVNTAILSRTGGYQGVGFAIPSDMVAPIMKMLVDKGKVVRGWLGVSIQDVDRELAATLKLPSAQGVLITDVVADSPAARAGLRRGDQIVKVAGKATPRTGNLRNAVAAVAGQTVDVEYVRGAERHAAKVAVVEQPDDRRADRPDPTPAAGDAGKLGLRVAPISPTLRRKHALPDALDHGVVVVDVVRGGAAEELGLQAGDVILELNRRAIRTAKDLEAAFRQAPRRLAILVYRDGATVYLMLQK
jgi:Do/DeqQ family serine protease